MRMRYRDLAAQLFAALTLRLALRNVSEIRSDPPNKPTPMPQHDVSTRLHLASLGVGAIAIVVVFFGLGLFLVPYRGGETIAGVGNRGPASQAQAFVLPSDADGRGSIAQTEVPHSAAATASLEARQVRPTGDGETTSGAGRGEATAGAPAGVTNARRGARAGRHRHANARRHWAAIWHRRAYHRPPAYVSGPRVVWGWINRGIAAALSPPPWR